MNFRTRKCRSSLASALLLMLMATLSSGAQQVVQRGALGRPAQVLDETGQWTTPLLVSSNHDVELYIPDVSNPQWLAANYRSFEDTGQFVLSMFTFYRTTTACKTNRIAWGFSDGAHLEECIDIGYRIRRATVDKQQKIVTLITAAMIGRDGAILPDSSVTDPVVRRWTDLDANTQEALKISIAMISKQMKLYDARVNSNP